MLANIEVEEEEERKEIEFRVRDVTIKGKKM